MNKKFEISMDNIAYSSKDREILLKLLEVEANANADQITMMWHRAAALGNPALTISSVYLYERSIAEHTSKKIENYPKWVTNLLDMSLLDHIKSQDIRYALGDVEYWHYVHSPEYDPGDVILEEDGIRVDVVYMGEGKDENYREESLMDRRYCRFTVWTESERGADDWQDVASLCTQMFEGNREQKLRLARLIMNKVKEPLGNDESVTGLVEPFEGFDGSADWIYETF